MFAKLLLVSLFFVMNVVVSVPSERLGLRRRRLSSECSESIDLSSRPELTKKDLGELRIGCTGETILDPLEIHFSLKREIARLSEMQKREARYIEDLRSEITGFASPIMRVLNLYLSGVEPGVMLAAFEEQQLVIIEKLTILNSALERVELYLLAQKMK